MNKLFKFIFINFPLFKNQMNLSKRRLEKELKTIEFSSPPGIQIYINDDSIYELEADIYGPEKSPYENGIFKVKISIGERYPFTPPTVRFITPIYHPNIDSGGRICLDILKMPPQGDWKPNQNISSVLLSIRLLMDQPNPKDGLVSDISEEYIRNFELFKKKAIQHTKKYAIK